MPAGAACTTRPGIGPGTPYFEDASETFRSALSKVDFDHDFSQIRIVAANSRVRDTLTLWNLLPRVSDADRVLVYDRLAVLVPPPRGVTRKGVLKLNQQMLDEWKEKLESRWGEALPPGLFNAWRRTWSRDLGKLHGLEGKR